jgi:hypothetical protein
MSMSRTKRSPLHVPRRLPRLGSVRLFGRVVTAVAILAILAAVGFIAYTIIRVTHALD